MKALLFVVILFTSCGRGLVPPTDNIVVVGHSIVGTGFYIDTFTIVTAAHVVNGDKKILITFSDSTSEIGTVISTDTAKDIALISVMTKRKPVDLSVINPKQGDIVAMIGHPGGISYAFTKGYVMKPLQQIDGVKYLIVDLNTFHGYSGAPIFNRKGKCIGMLQAFFTGTGISIALSLPELKLLIK